jgi:exoribonuclease R
VIFKNKDIVCWDHELMNLCCYRRHLPPPRTNFEKLQDILLKTKGMKLDTTSSGALAASLDRCVVRGCLSFG